jgi:hypothetical protein
MRRQLVGLGGDASVPINVKRHGIGCECADDVAVTFNETCFSEVEKLNLFHHGNEAHGPESNDETCCNLKSYDFTFLTTV